MEIQSILNFFFDNKEAFIRIVAIIVVAVLINRISKKIIERGIRSAIRGSDPLAEKKREDTLIAIFSGTVRVIVWVVAVMMLLSEVGVDIGPVMAGAGILGVALGFGAQYMVRDFLAGLFIILENQYRVGDVVDLDGPAGTVEDINLRRTVLRDFNGVQIFVPNGEIKKSSNMTKGFSKVNFNVGIGYGEDLEKVMDLLNKIGNELAEDKDWKDAITKPPQALGVDDFADSSVNIRILGETKPAKQWEVAREMKKRIKLVFDKEGIEIPFPQRVIWQKKG